MAGIDFKKYYEGQIEFAKKMIGYAENHLAFAKRQLARERKSDKEFVEYIWSRGVVTETEMRLFCKKGYKSNETLKLEKEARKERKDIRKYKAQIAEYEAKLAEYK